MILSETDGIAYILLFPYLNPQKDLELYPLVLESPVHRSSILRCLSQFFAGLGICRIEAN